MTVNMMNNDGTIIKTYDGFRSGFIAILGAPNAGKSTLLNRMLGEKISITSKKPQTTRDRIMGVLHRPSAQLVFVDTPGIHKTKDRDVLNEKMVEVAVSAIGDVDLILLMVDPTKPDVSSEEIVMKKLAAQKKPVILALNKIDLIKKGELLPKIESWSKAFDFKAIVPISAKHGEQVEELVQNMEKLLPEGSPLFPEDTLTDQSERFIVAEMIREKVFRLTGQEIPYSIAVTIDTFKVKNKVANIYATIHVEKGSQKGIIIGKGGEKLKKIGEDARKEIERFLEQKVFLKLFVRVEKNWSRDTKAMRRLGY